MATESPQPVEDAYWDNLVKGGSYQDARDDNEISLPDYYDQDKFRRGQRFIKDHIFAVFVGKVAGLITVLALQCYLDGIQLSTRSVFAIQTWSRYLRIMKYTFEFYNSLPDDNSECGKAIRKFKKLYLYSERPLSRNPITQRDLALCQFGFMGYIMFRPKLLGIDPEKSTKDLEAVNHFWRVIGHCIGLDSEFNLCADNSATTKERLLRMTPRFIGPAFVRHDSTYAKIVMDFVDIFWYFSPFISIDSIVFLSNRLAGIPGYYLSEEERLYDMANYEEHRGYVKKFNATKHLMQMYSPKCYIYMEQMSFRHKMITWIVGHVFERYLTSTAYRRLANGLIWFGLFCMRQFAFIVDQGLGFKSSYVSFWTKRNAMMKSETIEEPMEGDL